MSSHSNPSSLFGPFALPTLAEAMRISRPGVEIQLWQFSSIFDIFLSLSPSFSLSLIFNYCNQVTFSYTILSDLFIFFYISDDPKLALLVDFTNSRIFHCATIRTDWWLVQQGARNCESTCCGCCALEHKTCSSMATITPLCNSKV